ncbi:cytochrome P450 [Xanthomonas sp. GPE 39]|uniref:cytochrome P450 n=1 Tax=Xanthomonas sp. GPE 39 TaxID=1583099 RepID=UPI0005F27821|nr:cytochrome P450 [Xanthomonas sp. GPE 39]
MSAILTGREVRTTVFASPLQALLREHLGQDAFRLEKNTIGVAGATLIDQLLAARPATEHERPTFKPLQGRSITRAEAAKLMQAIGSDVREALKRPVPATLDLSGSWPHVGHRYLCDLLLGTDPWRLRVLMDRALELTPMLTWTFIAAGAALPLTAREDASALAKVTVAAGASCYRERRHAMGLYRRAAVPLCFTISALVANALWLGSPFDPSASNRNILYEAMRLLPPAWSLLRKASPEYVALDQRIGVADDLLVLPLLSHRDPALWEDAEVFRPDRWDRLDPDALPGYLPFGHASERCWGRHMVMPLAEQMLELLRAQDLVVSPKQRRAHVPLPGLLGVFQIDVVRQGRG